MGQTPDTDTTTIQENAGDAAPQFYLLRGLSREHGHWGEEFVEGLRENFPGAGVYFLDLPGAGRYYDQSASWSVKKMASFLNEEWADSLRRTSGNNILLATSLGSMVALEWLNTWPDAFDGTVFVSAGFRKVCKGSERVQPEAKRRSIDIILTGDMRQREAKVLNINTNHHDCDTTILTHWWDIQEQRPVSRWTLVKQGLSGMFYNPEKREVEVPVLLLGSEEDELVHPDCIADVSEWLDAETHMHPSSGHGIPIDAPGWIITHLNSWWESILAERVETRVGGNEGASLPSGR